jgi:AcrR family transcriptional regulator
MLEVAIAAIAEKGESGVRVNDVAAEVGVAITSLYHYFGSRDGLVIAAQTERYLRSLGSENERIVEALADCKNKAQFREVLLEIHRRVNNANRAPFRLIRVSVLGSTLGRPDLATAVGKAQDEFITSFSGFLAIAKERGWTRPDLDPVGASAWSIGQILGRIVIEIGESSVTDEQWAIASETALLAVVMGES